MIAGGGVIITLNGTRIRGGDNISAYQEAYKLPGQTVQVTTLKDDDERTILLVLGKRPTLAHDLAKGHQGLALCTNASDCAENNLGSYRKTILI